VNGSKLLTDTAATLNESVTVSYGSETLYRDDVPMRNPFNFLLAGARDILRTVTDHEAPQTQEDDHAAIQAASTEVEADLGHEQQSAAATNSQSHPANVPDVPQQTPSGLPRNGLPPGWILFPSVCRSNSWASPNQLPVHEEQRAPQEQISLAAASAVAGSRTARRHSPTGNGKGMHTSAGRTAGREVSASEPMRCPVYGHCMKHKLRKLISDQQIEQGVQYEEHLMPILPAMSAVWSESLQLTVSLGLFHRRLQTCD